MANILIVDDTPSAIEPLANHLEAAGHRVICVVNGREALASVLAHLPDVVILDLVMPEMDGPCFLEVIRSYLRLQALPVVVFTSLIDSPMVARIQALKVNCVLDRQKASLDDVRRAVDEAIVRLPG